MSSQFDNLWPPISNRKGRDGRDEAGGCDRVRSALLTAPTTSRIGPTELGPSLTDLCTALYRQDPQHPA